MIDTRHWELEFGAIHEVLYLMHLLITNTLILHILVGLMCAIVTTAGTAQRDRVVTTAPPSAAHHVPAPDSQNALYTPQTE